MKARKTLITSILLGAMALSFTSCAKVEYYDEDDFLDICEDELDVEEDDMLDMGGRNVETGYYFEYGDAYVAYFQYDSKKTAKKEFEEILDDFEDMKDDHDFKGSSAFVNVSDHGYLVMNGDVDDEVYYGGYYWNDDMIIMVFTDEDDKDAFKDVKEVIDAFGYKKP